jgi:hypothetical protein
MEVLMPNGQFEANPYQNPQMGTPTAGNYGAGQTVNPNSPYGQWMNSQQPAWMQNQEFFDPNNPGMNSYYNPYTGDTQQNYQGGVGFSSGMNAPFSGAVSWTDNMGNQMYDPSAMMNAFGMGGGGSGGGYQSYSPSDFQGGQITAPGAYGGGNWDPSQNPTSLHDLIESYRPTMEAEIGAGFAEAGSRLGQSGFAMSTPYANELGDVERLARGQMNQRALEYQFGAGQFDRQQDLARQLAQNQEMYGGWQTQGGWDMQAQGQNAQNAFNEWMAQNQWGFQDNQGQNQYNQNQEQQQQMMLMSLMGGMF